MFINKLKEQFKYNEPIFTEELFKLFPGLSRAQLFREINKSLDKKEIIRFTKGVYYIPIVDEDLDFSVISVDAVIYKKYIENNNNVYGIFNGIYTQNAFEFTTQYPGAIEIISNKESSKKREIVICGRRFIIRKPKFTITNENYGAYTLLQLFSELFKNDKFSDLSIKLIANYMKDNNVSINSLISLSDKFPSSASKTLLRSGLLNEITRKQNNI